MKVIRTIEITTKDNKEAFDIEELEGTPAPYAYHINYNSYAHAKFIIDDKSLSVFEK